MTNNNHSPVLHPMVSPSILNLIGQTTIVKGDGVFVYDKQGNELLDCMAGLWCVNVGHNHPKMNKAITEQLEKIAFYNSFVDFTNEPAEMLANELLTWLKPEQMAKVMFSSGGSDANETALKLARQYWLLEGQKNKTQFISLTNGYHGLHFGVTSITGIEIHKQAYAPLLQNCHHIPTPCLYRNPWTSDSDELADIIASQLEEKIIAIGEHNIAAFIAEPIQGAGGVIVPPAKLWPLFRKVCDKYNILLIADEVVTGFGRSGELFGCRNWQVSPDIMCLAKGLTSGYIPLGATVLNEKVAKAWQHSGPESMIMHGYTYSGHPLACAAGLTALSIVQEQQLHINAAQVGEYLLQSLRPFKEHYSLVGDVRGKGLMVVLDLVECKTSKAPLDPASPLNQQLVQLAQSQGVIIRNVGSKVILSPPLTFTRSHVDTLVKTLHFAFDRVSSN
ncbi:aminotransferase class III-fold pyridoxal phosphate-dependent enzyme [Pseudoalteromonas sp. JBTF-M23]|uniref:Aminotransferase class III-fold pyridoxal phosphate-dependent enzyme n=1 Tax=Pseudoalteromonas caenipelagi TaxID=2726988 RepID=A0A849VDZ9_9GAMM|nr:aminotransferase class III-fold pyridoxal phosphate-dependent enzyme [Pseudoalteromonas caenipelagi]NOU51018.1 aminotransferase class III-fold pyridoxal phosphate-dependent enzyme [Pseudoalteromonas caenipelagi]